MPGDDIFFKGWRISKLSFDAAKGEVHMSAFRDLGSSSFRCAEYYTYENKIEYIYGLEHFLTNLGKLSDNYDPATLTRDIKDFLKKHNFVMAV